MITFLNPMYWGKQNCIQPTDIANTGYVPGDNPAAEHENYFRRQTYLCLKELQSIVSTLNEYIDIMRPYIAIDAGVCGEGTEYSLCLDNTLQITGTGSIDASVFEHREDFSALEVNIGGNVGIGAFGGCTELNTANINCVKIGSNAFMGCSKLGFITIGENVTEIESGILTGSGFYIPNGIRIMYAGTTTEWNAITKADNWIGYGVTVENGVVICTDGNVEV